MEQEIFLSGYCRVLDQSRMVAVILEDGSLAEVDCHYGGCKYETDCPVARKIRERIQNP